MEFIIIQTMQISQYLGTILQLKLIIILVNIIINFLRLLIFRQII